MNAVDTNVLIYFYDERDPVRRAKATDTIKSIRDGVLLWQVACEFIAASRKLKSSSLNIEIAWKRLDELGALFPLVLPNQTVLDRARSMLSQHQLHFWDAMMYAACLEAGVVRFFSEDIPAAKIEGLEIFSPFE